MKNHSHEREISGDEPLRVYLTLEEANALLPEIEPRVRRMVALARDLQSRYERLAALPPNRREKHPLFRAEREAMEEEIRRDLERLKLWAAEIADLGAIVKSPTDGIVDFLSQHEGRDIFLCWKLGESEIQFWHEIDAGFSGRRSVCELDSKT